MLTTLQYQRLSQWVLHLPCKPILTSPPSVHRKQDEPTPEEVQRDDDLYSPN